MWFILYLLSYNAIYNTLSCNYIMSLIKRCLRLTSFIWNSFVFWLTFSRIKEIVSSLHSLSEAFIADQMKVIYYN